MSKVADISDVDVWRANIDRVDRQIVALLAERGGLLKQAARFKNHNPDHEPLQQAEEVIAKVITLSKELGANAAVTERVYRAMIVAFINAELTAHAGH